jgi:uncharacterized membrane protein YphA (DoxX/SURF4 family)
MPRVETTSVVPGLRIALGVVLIFAGSGKLAHPRELAEGVRGYGVPRWLAIPVGVTLALAELLLGVLLVMGWRPELLATAALLLFVAFLLAVGTNLARGAEMACHCFELLGQERIGLGTVFRLALLIIAAAVVAVLHPHGSADVSLTLRSGVFGFGFAILVLQIGRMESVLVMLRASPEKSVVDGRRVSLKDAPLAPVLRIAASSTTQEVSR